tara:strand:- start:366 stop:548 length:183 start_codon:yes stop_codon:yes gene_type:complete
MDRTVTTPPPGDSLSLGLARFIEGLSMDERESLIGMLKDSNTFLAEDMTDVMAILQDLGV